MSSEHSLLELPTSLVAFSMDPTPPIIPALAVAAASNVYVYKNMRPYFKFSLPSLEVNRLEKELW